MAVLFTSDYCEGTLPQLLKRLIDTNLDQTIGYGNDEACKEARETIKTACCAPDADVHFLVGGTQTNSTVISAILRSYQGVICASSAHINVHETGAIEHGGHKVLTLPSLDGKISATQIEEAVNEHYNEDGREHTVMPGMVYISFPTELGTIYSVEELEAISEVCHKYRLPLYVDGARLGYGIAASEKLYGGKAMTLAKMAELTDAFYIGGTKQGALFGEALVITNDEYKIDFRYYIKQVGALLAKGRLLGIQFQALFEDDLYMKASRSAVDLAQRIKAAFKAKGIGFFVDSPSNQIFPILTSAQIEALSKDFVFETWAHRPDGRTAVRFVTSWATTRENAEALINAINKL